MPALAHWFHLKPADLDDITVGEAEAYLAELKAIKKAADKKPR